MSKPLLVDTPIKKMGDVITGKTPATAVSENFGTDYMFITPNELHDGYIIKRSEKGLSKQGFFSIKNNTISGISVLVGCIGWDMGNVALCVDTCATNQQINSIANFRAGYNPYYVYYWLATKKDYLFQIASVTRTPILNKSTFEDISIPMPELGIQNKVVSVLSAIDRKISINNCIIAELEAMAKTIYDYWFVQFDFPDANGNPYRSNGGKMVWNEELKREIPEDWVVDKMNDTIAVKDGTHDSPKAQKMGHPLITSKHLLEQGIDFDNANLISEDDYIAINRRSKVDTGDLLFSMIGTVGTVYKVEEKDINFAIKNVALYKTSQKYDYKNYIYMYLRSCFMQVYMSNVLSGSIQNFIGLGDLRNMPLLISDTYIREFDQKTKKIFEQINNCKEQNQELSRIRDWLLPMLMNGQVTVE